MRARLALKLFVAILSVAVFAVLAMGVAARVCFNHGFLGYLSEQEAERLQSTLPVIALVYEERGSWQFVRNNPRAWRELLRPSGVPPRPTAIDVLRLPPSSSDSTGAGLRFVLLDADGQYVMGDAAVSPKTPRRPIVVHGRTVGWLVMAPFQQVTASGDLRFEQGQRRATWVVGTAAVLLAAVFSIWLTRVLLTPVRRIATATRALVSGNYTARVVVDSRDELGQLARDFNQLATVLERNEQIRRDIVADVSHELRTPLAVMRGELEALEDGVRRADKHAIRSLQNEVSTLNKLIDDLYELSLAHVGMLSYRKVSMNLAALLGSTAETYRDRLHRAGIALDLCLPKQPITVHADEQRLHQVFANLLENSLRYTDPGGQLCVRCTQGERAAEIDLMDSAPAVEEASLPRLFERFFRVETSRNRASGGAGLGLAICRAIIEAHGGSIEAKPSPLGGLWLAIRLPIGGVSVR